MHVEVLIYCLRRLLHCQIPKMLLEGIQSYSVSASISPPFAGLVAGVIHHFVLQTPVQAGLFPTLYGYAFSNSCFICLSLLKAETQLSIPAILEIIVNLSIFNLVYVSTL
jgi:hypothetical protein